MTARSRSRPAAAGDTPFTYVFAAVANSAAAPLSHRLPTMPGGGSPRLLPVARGLSIVVADVPQAIYAPSVLEPRLAQPDWVAAAAAAHHAVIERLARSHSLLPFRLFTIFSSDARARATIGATTARLRRALRDIEARDEWVLRIGPPDLSRGAKSSPPASRRPLESSGTNFLRVKAAAVQARRARAEEVHAAAHAVVAALEGLADRAITRPEPTGTTLIVDAAFLVSKRRRAALRRALTQHAAPLLSAGCSVSLTGPWPPYSFASIE